jgi:tyrosine-protein kinase Etk/Wzc
METEDKNGPQPLKPLDGQQRPNLVAYAATLLNWRTFIFRNVVAVTLLTIVVSFLLPRWYKSTATVLPPKDEGLLSGIANLGSVLKEFSPIRGVGGLGSPRGTYSYLSILNSRRAMEMAVAKFGLIGVYDISDSSMEKAVKEFSDNFEATFEDQGHISITVYDKDPKRAADIANYMVEVLNQISSELNSRESGSNREFLERRVAESRDSLKKAEELLKDFQEKYGVYTIPEQTQASLSGQARLFAEKALKEVEIGVKEQLMGRDNPELQAAKLELSVLNQKLGALPGIGMQYVRLYRDVLIQSKIVEVLMPLLEQVRLQEKRDTPVVVQLDTAVPAERKAKPKRLIIILSAAISSFLLSLLYIAAVERWRRFQQENPEKCAEFSVIYSRKRTGERQGKGK